MSTPETFGLGVYRIFPSRTCTTPSSGSVIISIDGLESFKLSFFKTEILTLSSSDTCALSDFIFKTPSCDDNNPGITMNKRIVLILLGMFMYDLFKNLQIHMAR